MYDFGLRLRELREKKGLSQALVATRLGISNATICCYEANTRYPSFDMIAQLALFYNTTSDYILGLDNRKMVCVDGLSEVQTDIIRSLISEFRLKK